MAESFTTALDLAPIIGTEVTTGQPSTAGMLYVLDGALILMAEDQDSPAVRRRAWVAVITTKDPG